MLDIKLKEKLNPGRLLVLLAIFLPAAAMLMLYPYFERRAGEIKIDPEYASYGIMEKLVGSSYVLYVKTLEQEEGRLLSPLEVYSARESYSMLGTEMVTEADEETDLHYYYTAQRQFLDTYDRWESWWNRMSSQVDVRILRGDGEELEGGDETMYQDGGTTLSISFDSIGRGSVKDVVTSDPNYGAGTKEILQMALYENMLSNSSDYMPNEPRLQNPTDFTVVYHIPPDSRLMEPRMEPENVYYSDGSVMLTSAVFLGLTAAAAMALSCFASLGLGKRRLFRAPFEVVAAGAILVFTLSFGMNSLVAASNSGQLAGQLLQMNFLPAVIPVLEAGFNFLCWAGIFAGAFWGGACLRDLFVLGIPEYLKRRTIVFRCVYWGKKQIVGFLEWAMDFDLQDGMNRCLLKIVGANFLIAAIFCFFWFWGIGALLLYSAALFFILRRRCGRMKQDYQILLKAANEIAQGNLDVSIDEDLEVFKSFKEEIQRIQSGFKKAVEEEVKSQRMKNELITNVSHDLKTPLTAIITYVNLLKEGKATPKEQASYIEILEQKSMRLKSLIEDLFEISKASSKNVTLNLVEVDIVALLKQVSLELEEKISQSRVEFRFDLPEGKLILLLDSQKTYRIFENLLVNIANYALPGTRAYIRAREEGDDIAVSMKNVSAAELSFQPDEITERFVRGDASRNTEGSGLGLAIAKSFTELQKGKLTVETEADLFKVELRWRKEKAAKKEEL